MTIFSLPLCLLNALSLFRFLAPSLTPSCTFPPSPSSSSALLQVPPA